MVNGKETVTDEGIACIFGHAVVYSFLRPSLDDGEAALVAVIRETYRTEFITCRRSQRLLKLDPRGFR